MSTVICELGYDKASRSFYGSFTPLTAKHLKRKQFDEIIAELNKFAINSTNFLVLDYLYILCGVMTLVLLLTADRFSIPPWIGTIIYSLIAAMAIYGLIFRFAKLDKADSIHEANFKSFLNLTCAKLTNSYSSSGIECKNNGNGVQIVYNQDYVDIQSDDDTDLVEPEGKGKLPA
ncbi:hypothetical protein HDV06_003673 [Boothiomyces sp. JEL0866]|nr:hypothetical protein HDV06_003673 [Boothiomyces sp. JEL0866]